MDAIDLRPIGLRDAQLVVDGDDYTAGINEVSFDPSVEWDFVPTFAGAFAPRMVGVAWTVTLGMAQDFETAESLTLWLVANAGQRRTVTFAPRDGAATVTADVLVMPGRLGGPSAELLTSSVQLPLFGQPVIG